MSLSLHWPVQSQLRHSSIAHSLGLASYNTVNHKYFVFKIFHVII